MGNDAVYGRRRGSRRHKKKAENLSYYEDISQIARQDCTNTIFAVTLQRINK